MADLKASLCGELPNQESAIPKEQLRSLLERRGIVGDPDIPNAKARLAEQELRRNMYHNTQVMLKHYRDIVWALECFPSEVAQELDQPLKDLDALLSVVDTQVALGNAKLEHRLLSIRKSRLLLDRINEALTVLRHKPGNGELMYNIIFQTFITPDKPSHSDITAAAQWVPDGDGVLLYPACPEGLFCQSLYHTAGCGIQDYLRGWHPDWGLQWHLSDR